MLSTQRSALARLPRTPGTAAGLARLTRPTSSIRPSASIRAYGNLQTQSSSTTLRRPISSLGQSRISERAVSSGTAKTEPSSSSPAATSSSPPASSNPPLTSYLPTQSQIHVLPFLLKPEWALKRLNAFSIATSRDLGAALKWTAHAFLPSIFPDEVPLKKWQMVYVPGWCVQADVSVTGVSVLNNSDMRDLPSPIEFKTEFSYFPGTSSFPISHISSTPTLSILPEYLKTFNPERDLSQHDESVIAIPFDTSPLVGPLLLHNATDGDLALKTHFDHFVVDDPKTGIKWKQLDVTPVYLPFYLASYEYGGVEKTLMLEATSEVAGECEIHFPNPLLLANSDRPTKPYACALHKDPSSAPHHFSAPPLLDLLPPSLPQPLLNGDPKSNLKDLVATSKKTLAAKDLHDRVGEGMERWMDAKGRREVLRRVSIGEVKREEGVFVGRIVKWEGVAEEEEEEEDDGEE